MSGLRWLWVSLFIILSDQWSKGWIEITYVLGQTSIVFSWLNITRLHNTGAAFSFLADAGGWQRWFFTALALAVSGVLLWWLKNLLPERQKLLGLALALVLGGAIGNVIDRIEHGYVVDFIHVHWGGAFFPAFNIADAAISIGAVFLFLDALREGRRI